MGYADILNKTFLNVVYDPEENTIYMLDDQRFTYEAEAKTDKDGCSARIVSVRGSEHLVSSPVHSVGVTDVESELYGGGRITLVETKIETQAGACLIVTCMYNGKAEDKALLSIERCKGFPSADGVPLVDFAHCPKDKRRYRHKRHYTEGGDS